MVTWLTLTLVLAVLMMARTQKNHSDPCSSKLSCGECIQTPTCVWCSKPLGSARQCSPKPRCTNNKYITKAENEVNIIKNVNFTSNMSSSPNSTPVQISPQKVSLKLRLNQPHSIKFAYQRAGNPPIDLYYLMDLSSSMKDDKDKVSSLSSDLIKSMQEQTTDLRLGFGSFVDKVAMPYVSFVPERLKAPCKECVPPYGFKHHMKLSSDVINFQEKVNSANVSGNLDEPEGGFDALMQAVVCQESIGWRNTSRRLLVFSTDAGFHYAGDGKLGGIIPPNDEECHLDGTGHYTHSILQDYPSIAQVNHKVKENKINVIFAVTDPQFGIYSELQNRVEGSSSALLSNDSSNVVDLVQKQYKKLASTVEIKNTTSQWIKVKYNTTCMQGSDGKMEEINKCEGINVGSRVEFLAEFLADSCPEDPKDWKTTINIYPVGITESLVVDVELLCGCECEKKNHSEYEEKSEKCSTNGNYMCGSCKCDNQYIGHKCECHINTPDIKDVMDDAMCRLDNTTTEICSGRGRCRCGVCDCDSRENSEVISGTYCECDNFSCNRDSSGLLCSGSDHGTCECGDCKCKPGWKGASCDCSTTYTTCIVLGSSETCSGNGQCVCGECKCNEGSLTGKYCEKISVSQHCTEFHNCVQCQMYQKRQLNKDECAINCTTFTLLPVEYIEVDEEKKEELCTFFDDDGCLYQFAYSFNATNEVMIRAQKDPQCPAKANVTGIVVGVIAAILLIGLAILLIWKWLIIAHDRREYEKFEKELLLAKSHTENNPLFKQATATFLNPTYSKK